MAGGISISMPVDAADDLLRGAGHLFGDVGHLVSAPFRPAVARGTDPDAPTADAPAAAGPVPAIAPAKMGAAAPQPTAARIMTSFGAPAGPMDGMPAAAPATPAPAIQPAGQQHRAPKALRVLGHIGDVVGTMFAPEAMALIPGTTLNKEYQQGIKTAQMREQGEQDLNQANIGRVNAETGLENAEADAARNKPQAPFNAEQTFFTQYAQEHPGAPIEDAMKAYTDASTKTTPATLRNVELAGPDGKPMEAVFNPQTGAFMDGAGRPIQTPAPYVAPGDKLVTGSVGGKPAFAVFDPAAGGFLDPATRQPLAGFGPDDNSRLTGMGAYTLSRILQEETSDNPAVRVLIPAMLDKLGIPLTPDQKAQLTALPAGQPTNAAGQPIGTRMPEAPTGATRSRGQFARAASDQIGRIRQEINQLGPELGPLSGRWNEFYTGSIGADNPAYFGLYTDLHNLATAWMRLHANSDSARQEFENILSTAKSPADLQSALTRIEDQANDYVKIGAGNPGGASPRGGVSVTDPNGGVHLFPDQAAADKFKKLAGIK